MDRISSETMVKPVELAAVLGLTGRRIRQLTEDGMFRKTDGAYNLAESVQAYIRQATKETSDEDRKIDQSKRKAEMMLKASKAQVAKLEAEELAGKMHRADDVEAIMDDMIFTIRDALMALPGRLAVDAAAAGSPAEASDVIRREVHKIMTELADYQYDPEKFEERVRERMEWSMNDDDE